MGRFRWLLLTFLLVSTLAPLTRGIPAHAEVLAPNWVIYDVSNEVVLDGQDMNARVAMASLTKVMTGLLVSENLSPTMEVTIVEGDLAGEANIGIQAGDVVSVRTLLHGMMMRSGNDAAAALGRAAGGSPDRESEAARDRFVDMMNERAAELGMNDTSFANPHGLDAPGHYSTARDLARLTEEVLNHPRLMQAFGARTYSSNDTTYNHSNQLPLQYRGVLGGKTGWTFDAGLCLIEMVEKDGRILIVVLLGSTFERWYPDAIELSDYGWTLPEPATTANRAETAFEWWRSRTDAPVAHGQDARSWLWGPEPISDVRLERYADARGGERMVQYFDKGRMEINDPTADITSGWYITGGHLAQELISGNRQVGDGEVIFRGPAGIPAIGDPDGGGPTYRDLNRLTESNFQSPGDTISLSFGAQGTIRRQSRFEDYEVELLPTTAPTGHGIASVFDDYLNQSGPVVERGQLTSTQLFDPRDALIGFPVTEPVWTQVTVGGAPRDVLIQCFERRCLTYTPDNDEDWQVEMGNIGQHYLAWDQRSRMLSLYDLPYRQDYMNRWMLATDEAPDSGL